MEGLSGFFRFWVGNIDKRNVGLMESNENRSKVFFFIGPEKTGTTTIFDLLPFDRVPAQKEQFNLSRQNNINAELKRIQAQLNVQKEAFIVEPTYFVSSYARNQLSALADYYEIHIVHTRRNPVDRMFSHYLHHKAKGRVTDPESAVEAYPEIVDASRYEKHADLWEGVADYFHIIDVNDSADLSSTLKEIGISPREVGALQSNKRMAPRSITIARFFSKLWQVMIKTKLNRLVPVWMKKLAKDRVYYGGETIKVDNEERKCLMRML